MHKSARKEILKLRKRIKELEAREQSYLEDIKDMNAVIHMYSKKERRGQLG